MKTFKEILEALQGRQSLDRVYSSNFKLIQIPGKPGETSERTKSADGTEIPAGYRKFRAGAVVFSKSPREGEKAPDFRTSDDESADRSKVVYTKHRQAIKKIYQEEEGVELDEAKISQVDIPYLLNLKRVTVRQYPNNVQVALYYNEKLKKYFSITFDGKDKVNITEESFTEKILETYSNLSEDNKQIFLKMVKEDFDSIRKFVLTMGDI